MCTVSWAIEDHGFFMAFNRDERKSRKAGKAPELKQSHSVRFLSPTDGDFGGTWLGANEHGLILGLLNYYPDPKPPTPINKLSRGFIIPKLMVYRNVAEMGLPEHTLELNRFESFELLLLEPDGKGKIWRWDGLKMDIIPADESTSPLSSSSFVTQKVVDYRKERFPQVLTEIPGSKKDAIITFQTRQDHPDAAYNPRMWREDAKTVSITTVSIDSGMLCMNYYPQMDAKSWDHVYHKSTLPLWSKYA